MRKLTNRLLLVFFLLLPTLSYAAISADTVWEYRTAVGSSNNNGGGFVWINLVSATYKWTASGSGTNEYYCELAGGGNPSLSKASVTTDGTFKLDTEGVMGSLTAGQWDYGDNDSLGYSTVYVRLDDGADPDVKNIYFVCLGKGGGTDYSQQASPQYALTSATSAGAGAVVLHASAAADMVGNICNIVSGTNFTTGRYEIISVSAGVSFTVDRNCTTDIGADGVINVGGSLALPLDAIFEAMVAGNRIFMKNDGTYTLTESLAMTLAGTTASPIYLEGYNSTRGDKPTGLSRPSIATGAYTFGMGSYWNVENFNSTGTATYALSAGQYSSISNCKGVNLSITASRDGLIASSYSRMFKNEAVSMVGDALQAGTSMILIFNYIHDSSAGFDWSNYDYNALIGNVIAECLIGIEASTGGSIQNTIAGNILYKGDNATGSVGLSTQGGTGNTGWIVVNNIVTGFATGMDWGNAEYQTYIDYNNFYSNTTDIEAVNLVRGLPGVDHNIYTDPLLNNPNGTLIDDGEDAWNEYAGTGVTATADGTTYKIGTYSARATCLASTDVEVVMTEAISSTDMSGYNGIAGWFRSSVALNAGDWQLLLDDSANCGTPIVTLSLPAMSANTWYWVYLNNTSFASATAIISIGVKQAVDKGALSFYVDNLRARDCDFTVQSGSGILDTGMQPATTEGIVGDYKWNIGADQDDNAAGGSVTVGYGCAE